jgi:peptide/nickel transport system substrate-binding protein
MKTTRRGVLKAGAAGAAIATVGAPPVARAQAKPPRQVRMVPHGDLRVLDPIWTTANMSA